MPDTKFSWRGLREHLRKYLWLYLLGIVVSLVGTELLWTMTSPRLSIGECITICLADDYSDPQPLEAFAPALLERAQAEDGAIRQVQFESLLFNDEVYTSNMLLLTRLSVGECDAFLASPEAMEALVSSGVLVPLDDALASGWLGEYGLAPYVVTTEDEGTGESATWTAGLRLDGVNALSRMGAFDNTDACLCVATNGGNVNSTMQVLDALMRELTEASDAGTEAA